MGRMYAEGFINLVGKAQALDAHLVGNFYPPLPGEVRDVIHREFNKYWDESCSQGLLLKRINKGLKPLGKDPLYCGPVGLRSLDYFDMFLDREEE